MKIFLSWSGEPSRTVALALHEWIPYLLQSVEPWMSGADLEAGVRWNDRIQRELSETKFGIVCVTPGNFDSSWLLFESGALAKTIEDAYVCPYLVGLDPSELTGPLAQFQAKRASRDDTHSLVHTMNRALGAEALDAGRLDRSFERWWPDLEQTLSFLPAPEGAGNLTRRSQEDLLEEILLLVRNIDKQSRTRRAALEPTLLGDRLRASPPWSDPDELRYWLTVTMADREHLKGLYNVLRDKLAERPAETPREGNDNVEDLGGGE